MSNNILESIERLVFTGKAPIVVALTGGWGEGKSYFWNEKIAKSRSPKPAYVSVFGADTLISIREKTGLACLQAQGQDVLKKPEFTDRVKKIWGRTSGAVLSGGRILLSILNKSVQKKIGVSLPESFVVELLRTETEDSKNFSGSCKDEPNKQDASARDGVDRRGRIGEQF